jgi:hypothetical protein
VIIKESRVVGKRKKQPFLLKFYQFVRRLGVPHEETIGLPVVITLLALTQAQKSNISVPLEYTIIIAGLVLSGAWLGLAWNRMRFLAIVFRTFLIAALIIGGYAIGQHPDAAAVREAPGHFLTIAVQTFGALFYLGWMLGTTMREWIVTLYISPERRRLFDSRTAEIKYLLRLLRHPWPWLRYWTQLAFDRASKEEATTFDLIMARLISKAVTLKGIVVIAAGVAAIVALIRGWHGFPL